MSGPYLAEFEFTVENMPEGDNKIFLSVTEHGLYLEIRTLTGKNYDVTRVNNESFKPNQRRPKWYQDHHMSTTVDHLMNHPTHKPLSCVYIEEKVLRIVTVQPIFQLRYDDGFVNLYVKEMAKRKPEPEPVKDEDEEDSGVRFWREKFCWTEDEAAKFMVPF